jgi:hypothetical protein
MFQFTEKQNIEELDICNFHTFYKNAQSKVSHLINIAFSTETTFLKRKELFKSHKINYKESDKGSTIIFKLKYSNTCDFSKLEQYACRGTSGIATKNINSNNYDINVIFPANKFFNSHEISSKFGVNYPDFISSLRKQGFRFLYTTKLDGSCLHIFFDSLGNIHVYTLGCVDKTIKMQGAFENSPTFSEYGEKLLKEQHSTLYEYLKQHPFVSCQLELMTKWNHIVTTYDKDIITPFLIIDKYGNPTWDNLSTLCPDVFINGIPKYSWIVEDTDNDDIVFQSICDEMNRNPDIYGKNPEGVCGYVYKIQGDIQNGVILERSICFPIVKRKRKEYLIAHSNISLNIGEELDKKKAQKLLLTNSLDDEPLYSDCQPIIDHIKLFQKWIDKSIIELSQLIPILRHIKHQKEYAEIINKLDGNLKSIKQVFFMYKKTSNYFVDETDTEIVRNFLCDKLLMFLIKTKEGPIIFIDILHKNGSKWFIETEHKIENFISSVPEVSASILVVSDFDNTFMETCIPCGVNVYEYLSTFSSLHYKLIEKTINTIKGYLRLGKKVDFIVLTGRISELQSNISDIVSKALELPPSGFRVICSDGRQNTVTFKTNTLKDIVSFGNYKNVFHFEDDNNVLKSCSQILDPITRYVGINVIKDNETYKFQPVECKPTISFTIVGAPCSYKTTIITEIKCRLEKQGRIVVIVSPDLEESILRVKPEYSDISVKIPPEIKFGAIQRKIKKVPMGSVVLYDMCHDKGDMLKDILKSNGLAVTFVPHNTTIKKTKNGDKESHSSVKEYVNYIIKKAINRSESRKYNGTSLITSNVDKLTKIITDKISGCVHQKTTRDVKYLGDGSILNYDQQLELVWAELDKFLLNSQDEKVIGVNSFYIGAPVDIPNLSEDGYYQPDYPHITLIPPGNEHLDLFNLIGKPLKVNVHSIIKTPNTYVYPVFIDGWDRHISTPHITTLVKNNHFPRESGIELSEIDTKTDLQFIRETYSVLL